MSASSPYLMSGVSPFSLGVEFVTDELSAGPAERVTHHTHGARRYSYRAVDRMDKNGTGRRDSFHGMITIILCGTDVIGEDLLAKSIRHLS